jgi:hypothetical protein
MIPDDTGEDGDVSDDVCTVMEIEPGVAAPIVKPLMVMVNAAVAPMVAPDVARTTALLLVDVHIMFRPGALLVILLAGLREGKKKFGGYVIVMKPPGGTSRGTLKVNVTEALALPAIRSDGAMAKVNNDGDERAHDPVGPMTKTGQTHATGARNVRPLCTTATSKDDRAKGTLALTITNTSTADTAMQLVDTEPSRNRALHAAPAANGLPVTVTEEWEASSTWGVTLMMTGAWASRSGMA